MSNIIVRQANWKRIKGIASEDMVQVSANEVEKGVDMLLLLLLFYSCYEVYPNTIGIFPKAKEMQSRVIGMDIEYSQGKLYQ